MYKRILLKLSGAALSSKQKNGLIIDNDKIKDLTNQIKELKKQKISLAIVIGGGNILRGASAAKLGMDRAQADYMGMIATVMNGLALEVSLKKSGLDVCLMSAIPMDKIADPYILRNAINHLDNGKIVILSGGTGSPFFTTDSAAALRAAELKANLIMMGKNKVDGIYDKDPIKFKDAKRYSRLSFKEAFEKKIQIMDLTATTICMENDIDILVFNINRPNSIVKTLTNTDHSITTIVSNNLKDKN